MKKEVYDILYKFEDSYWWFKAMRYIKIRLLRRYGLNKKSKLLDVGCGTGGFLKTLNKLCIPYGIDVSKHAINYCKQRGLKKLKLADINHLPFSDNSFDFITCNDVLYHKNIQNESKAINELYRILKPGGVLLISDVAINTIKNQHDDAFDGKKRFSKREMLKYLDNKQFKILKATYLNFILFPLVFIKRMIGKLFVTKTKTDYKSINPFLNNLLYKILKFEFLLVNRFSLPIGSTILIIAKKR